MIPITIGDEKFKLVFKHHFYGNDPFYYSPTAPVKAYTRATIFNKDNEPWVSGTAFCAVSDKFEKERGRRLSLQKALSIFSRDLRRRVFEQYENRPRKARVNE